MFTFYQPLIDFMMGQWLSGLTVEWTNNKATGAVVCCQSTSTQPTTTWTHRWKRVRENHRKKCKDMQEWRCKQPRWPAEEQRELQAVSGRMGWKIFEEKKKKWEGVGVMFDSAKTALRFHHAFKHHCWISEWFFFTLLSHESEQQKKKEKHPEMPAQLLLFFCLFQNNCCIHVILIVWIVCFNTQNVVNVILLLITQNN